jgi:hypothetical protein
MLFKLVGTGTHNQGAELMAAAVSEWIYGRGEGRTILVDHFFGPPQDRRKYGFAVPYTPGPVLGRRWLIDRLLHRVIREQLGLYLESDVKVFLDASGFQYSDQWGPEPVRELQKRFDRIAGTGKKYIFLPQAFGPFKNREVREKLKDLLPHASLIYARDLTSYKHLESLLGLQENLRMAPDFTSLVAPSWCSPVRLPRNTVLVVPNIRMIDKSGDSVVANQYVPMLAQACITIRKLGLNVYLLAHSCGDLDLAKDIAGQITPCVDIIHEGDPRVVKGVISQASALIGSRFHALQSALSQGIPCLIWGWSHKYRELCNDYECNEFLIEGDLTVNHIISFASKVNSRPELREHLLSKSESLRMRVYAMWDEIEKATAS